MVTIGSFETLEKAEIEAGRLRDLGIEVFVVQNNGGGWMPFLSTSVEIQIDQSELHKLDALKEEVLETRQHRCPECGSANYQNFVTLAEHFSALLTGILGLVTALLQPKRTYIGDDEIAYKCRDCGAKFELEAGQDSILD